MTCSTCFKSFTQSDWMTTFWSLLGSHLVHPPMLDHSIELDHAKTSIHHVNTLFANWRVLCNKWRQKFPLAIDRAASPWLNYTFHYCDFQHCLRHATTIDIAMPKTTHSGAKIIDLFIIFASIAFLVAMTVPSPLLDPSLEVSTPLPLPLLATTIAASFIAQKSRLPPNHAQVHLLEPSSTTKIVWVIRLPVWHLPGCWLVQKHSWSMMPSNGPSKNGFYGLLKPTLK